MEVHEVYITSLQMVMMLIKIIIIEACVQLYILSLQMVMMLIKIIIVEASARGVYYISANINDNYDRCN